MTPGGFRSLPAFVLSLAFRGRGRGPLTTEALPGRPVSGRRLAPARDQCDLRWSFEGVLYQHGRPAHGRRPAPFGRLGWAGSQGGFHLWGTVM